MYIMMNWMNGLSAEISRFLQTLFFLSALKLPLLKKLTVRRLSLAIYPINRNTHPPGPHSITHLITSSTLTLLPTHKNLGELPTCPASLSSPISLHPLLNLFPKKSSTITWPFVGLGLAFSSPPSFMPFMSPPIPVPFLLDNKSSESTLLVLPGDDELS